jgi:redox-regulated HSP33 family molecular chaperone
MQGNSKVLLAAEYDEIKGIGSDKLVAIRKKEKWAFYNVVNQQLSGFDYKQIGMMTTSGLMPASNDQLKFGFLNENITILTDDNTDITKESNTANIEVALKELSEKSKKTAKFIVVLDPPKHTPGRQAYQGIVPLEGNTVAQALEQYMLRSEQLHTRIWLAADALHCSGLLIQRLPLQGGAQQTEIETADESWARAQHLAQTLTPAEMLSTDQDTLLHRLFWQETLLVFESQPITWKCSCTQERVADMLRMLGKAEVDEILQEQGKVEVACEFCGLPYVFDALDTEALFQTTTVLGSKSVH